MRRVSESARRSAARKSSSPSVALRPVGCRSSLGSFRPLGSRSAAQGRVATAPGQDRDLSGGSVFCAWNAVIGPRGLPEAHDRIPAAAPPAKDLYPAFRPITRPRRVVRLCEKGPLQVLNAR